MVRMVRRATPLDNYRLLLEFETGSSITVDLSDKLYTARFAELKDEAVFRDVKTDGERIIWGGHVLRVPAEDLIHLAVTGI